MRCTSDLPSAGEGASLKADAARAAAQDFLGRRPDTLQDDPVVEPAAATITSWAPRARDAAGAGIATAARSSVRARICRWRMAGAQAFEHATASPSAAELGDSEIPSPSGSPCTTRARVRFERCTTLRNESPPLLQTVLMFPDRWICQTFQASAFSPSFADNGRELVFHMGRDPSARLVSARLAPEGHARSVMVLSDDRARSYHARRSPDGRFVAFDSDREGERAVYVARSDWSEVRRVSGPDTAALPTWSPDMKWLAFVRGEPGHTRVWNLWLREVSWDGVLCSG